LLVEEKAYEGTIRLGTATDTLDRTGTPVDTAPVPALAQAALDALAARFTGRQQQVPPMYSALKRDGVPLYALARRGLEVGRSPATRPSRRRRRRRSSACAAASRSRSPACRRRAPWGRRRSSSTRPATWRRSSRPPAHARPGAWCVCCVTPSHDAACQRRNTMLGKRPQIARDERDEEA